MYVNRTTYLLHHYTYLPMLSQAYDVIIDHGFSASGHYIEVLDDLNAADKKICSK